MPTKQASSKYIIGPVRHLALTATVLMPDKSVTVAEPPKISIELTMMLVARLMSASIAVFDLESDEDYPKNVNII